MCVIQPSLEAFRSNQFLYYGKRFLVVQNDPLLDKFWEQVQSTPVNPVHHGTALFDVAVALTTQGIALADLTPAAVLYYAWECRRQGLVLGARPDDEYRNVTEQEWREFEEHSDRRKVELGGCMRPYGTSCQHEHSCLRCPMLAINPKMLPRLDEIEDDLLARRARAEHEA